MSTITINTADPIGLIEAREKFPHITGSGIRLLQVEYLRNGTWSPPAVHAGIAVKGTATPASGHARQVLNAFAAIAPGVESIQAMEANRYIRDSLRTGFAFDPLPAEWDIENHSYGAGHAMSQQAIEKMRQRVERDNVLVVAAHPNSVGEIALPLWFRSDHVLVVGGADKDFGWTTWGEKVRVPHIRGAHKDSSIACAEVSAVAALVIQAIRATGAPAHWSVVRKVLIGSAQNGVVNAARALERVLGAPAVEIQPPAEPEAPEPPEQPDDTAPEVVTPVPPEDPVEAPPVDRYAIVREMLTDLVGEDDVTTEECEWVIEAVDRQREAWAKEGRQ